MKLNNRRATVFSSIYKSISYSDREFTTNIGLFRYSLNYTHYSLCELSRTCKLVLIRKNLKSFQCYKVHQSNKDTLLWFPNHFYRIILIYLLINPDTF